MPLFKWKDSYSVGVEELDLHHKKLFGILNTLYEGSLVPDGNLDIADKIDALIAYTEYHFAAEEEHLKQIGYLERESHFRLHRSFIKKVSRLQRKSHLPAEELTQELIVFLGNWLLHHVLEEDKKYVL